MHPITVVISESMAPACPVGTLFSSQTVKVMMVTVCARVRFRLFGLRREGFADGASGCGGFVGERGGGGFVSLYSLRYVKVGVD